MIKIPRRNDAGPQISKQMRKRDSWVRPGYEHRSTSGNDPACRRFGPSLASQDTLVIAYNPSTPNASRSREERDKKRGLLARSFASAIYLFYLFFFSTS